MYYFTVQVPGICEKFGCPLYRRSFDASDWSHWHLTDTIISLVSVRCLSCTSTKFRTLS
ncbi:hypothetical protein BGW80DRAFT_1351201, partial [Lactifluus volemus]